MKRWSATVAATAISIYILDVVATLSGVALVASGLLHRLDLLGVSVFLAASYVVWGFGLREALKANWNLLETTGTSTNIVSKAAHDLALRYSGGETVRRLASGAGYVVVELAKEAPYYAGAFGAAAFSETISSREALIFLCGANLGAACYELGLAWATRSCLAGSTYASFEQDWSPADYLAQYYAAVEPDERRTIAFLVDAVRSSPATGPVLFFGVGPTLHHVFSVAHRASEIHLGDYLGPNLREIERWIDERPDAHDWRQFVRYTLQCEGLAAPTERDVLRREALTRAKITELMEVDLRRPTPLGERRGLRYGMVISAYCADSITSDRETWEIYMGRIAELVSDGGVLITAALRGARHYRIGEKSFPSANVDEFDVRAVLERFCDPQDIRIEACDVPGCARQGYGGIVLARARIRRVLSEAA
ncbi:guanitoxin biosynthesis pre-guanitoxin forming N-methyltransferase GntF [Methylopila sp. M107]|uniref:guanitoxin biosynthesis pre-guanitoxin forming N-methyltransferase GntF n=1 Tax=Methylopila sp. M107 TaxID=1101190 RepID=UPI0003A8B4BC|nr:guanitoxin biosynthesis pre-guanitoxin forming N-methyltransferase GntF [Methylopila sp. M107]